MLASKERVRGSGVPTQNVYFQGYGHVPYSDNGHELYGGKGRLYGHIIRSDDLPAHLKASLLGHSVMIPITGGELNMGIWQGIYLGEHRDSGGSRRVLATLQGQGQGQ